VFAVFQEASFPKTKEERVGNVGKGEDYANQKGDAERVALVKRDFLASLEGEKKRENQVSSLANKGGAGFKKGVSPWGS